MSSLKYKLNLLKVLRQSLPPLSLQTYCCDANIVQGGGRGAAQKKLTRRKRGGAVWLILVTILPHFPLDRTSAVT